MANNLRDRVHDPPSPPQSVDSSLVDAATYPAESDEGWVRRSAVIESVYDGDTLTAVTLNRVGPDTITADRVRVRLAHIDAPEIRTRDTEEKTRGFAARDRLTELAPPGTVVVLHDMGGDKYGRTLGQVTAGGVNVAEQLLREGHAVPYGGGAR